MCYLDSVIFHFYHVIIHHVDHLFTGRPAKSPAWVNKCDLQIQIHEAIPSSIEISYFCSADVYAIALLLSLICQLWIPL